MKWLLKLRDGDSAHGLRTVRTGSGEEQRLIIATPGLGSKHSGRYPMGHGAMWKVGWYDSQVALRLRAEEKDSCAERC